MVEVFPPKPSICTINCFHRFENQVSELGVLAVLNVDPSLV
jgi:hypothetical protein